MPRKPKPYALLRREITEKGYDQEYLAKKIGRCETYLNQRLCGHKSWEEDDMYKLMDMLQLPYDYMHEYFPPRGIPAKYTKFSGVSPPRRYKLPLCK